MTKVIHVVKACQNVFVSKFYNLLASNFCFYSLSCNVEVIFYCLDRYIQIKSRRQRSLVLFNFDKHLNLLEVENRKQANEPKNWNPGQNMTSTEGKSYSVLATCSCLSSGCKRKPYAFFFIWFQFANQFFLTVFYFWRRD